MMFFCNKCSILVARYHKEMFASDGIALVQVAIISLAKATMEAAASYTFEMDVQPFM